MPEIHRAEKYVQLKFSTLRLDKESEICRYPYLYLRDLTDTNQKDADTLWLKGKDFSISVASDTFYEVGELKPETPFVTIGIWPKEWIGSVMAEHCYIHPDGTSLHHIYEHSESILNAHILPEIPEIRWKMGHEHAAKVALFVESHVSDSHNS